MGQQYAGGRLQGRVAIVTGAARGMGAATAERFAREGAIVYAVDLTPAVDSLVDTLRADGLAAHAHVADIASESDWQALIARAVDEQGGLDILVNNAGIQGDPAPIDAIAVDEWQRVIGVNLTGSFMGIKYAVPAMRMRGKGSIVQIGSTFGARGVNGFSAYSASKAAVMGMVRNAAMTLVGEGIRVNAVVPGLVETPLVTQNDAPIEQIAQATPMGRAGQPHEVAAASLFLASDEASFITGVELFVDGGYNARGQLNM